MKTLLLSLLSVWLPCFQLVAADAPAKSPPRFKALVICFNGKADSGNSCSVACFQPDGNLHSKGGPLKCGSPGQISAVEWTFVEQRGSRDVYRFKRVFPFDTADSATTSKTVEFSGSRVVVFEDKFQVIVMESPKK